MIQRSFPSSRLRTPKRRRGGFTIIELVIVLVITAILASLAVYSYNRLVYKARFTQAKTALKHLQKMETIYFSESDRYTDNLAVLDFDPVKYDYYEISVTLYDNALNYVGSANGVGAMKGDLWFITRNGEPEQDNTAKTKF